MVEIVCDVCKRHFQQVRHRAAFDNHLNRDVTLQSRLEPYKRVTVRVDQSDPWVEHVCRDCALKLVSQHVNRELPDAVDVEE